MSTAVIPAEPDAYDIGRGALMGRHAAGHAFLRAAVGARGDQPILGRTAAQAAAARFRQILGDIDPTAPFEWVRAQDLNRLSKVGVLYIGDPSLARYARMRLRTGLTSFSVCGVTHTTATPGTMDHLTDLVREPTAPWDALICTSTSVVETIRRVHEAEADYQHWRFGVKAAPQGPQLPLIPLGVHCDDFTFSPEARATARRDLEIEDDEVVGLFVGRLVFHAKAHPYPVLRAFQMAAERTGRKLVLIFSGWFPHVEAERTFKAGAASFARDVRVHFLDGRIKTVRDRAWAASDIFVSPSDNIQETFGLTPVEAMAAGLPVVVSDYDGYRDTVRHEVDGFRIKTWAPSAGYGEALARAIETGFFNYDAYCWGAASVTAVEVGAYADAVSALVERPDLRRKMGQAGRRRAREDYDWSIIYRQYQALWDELNARRSSAASDPGVAQWIVGAPQTAPGRLDPFVAFGHYPTATLSSVSRLALVPSASPEALRVALNHTLFNALTVPHEAVTRLFAQLALGDMTLDQAAVVTGAGGSNAMRAAALLLKMGFARVVE